MIRDPLLKQQALNMYRVYLIRCLTQSIDDAIDRRESLSFEEWVKREELFKDNWI